MKKSSTFQIPFRSFYSTALYREAAFDWKGTGFAYILALLAIIMIPTTLRFHTILTSFIRNYAPRIVSQVPQITFAHGVANVDAPQPYSIIDPKTHKVLVVIDTTGKISSLKETDAICLVTKTETIVRKSEIETRTFNYKGLDQFVLDQQKIAGWLEIARKYAALAFYPVVLAGSFLFRIIQLLIYAAIGVLFASFFRAKLPYDALLRLSAVAVTPGIIIHTILLVVGIRVPLAGLWFFLLAMIYLFIEVQESAKAAEQTVDNSEAGQASDDPEEKKWF